MAKRFVVYGRVQGVGFRYFTWKELRELALKAPSEIVLMEAWKLLPKVMTTNYRIFIIG